MKIRALIVEDEPLAMRYLRSLLVGESDLEIIGECEGGLDAVRAILEHKPDLVFLDVQIPELDGFGVLGEVRASGVRLPAVIFVTAHDQHALRAFEVHAIDYVLKPYGHERLFEAIEKARQLIRRREIDELSSKVHTLLDEVRSTRREYAERLTVRERGRVVFVAVGDVVWVGAESNRLTLHTAKGKHLLNGTLQWLEGRLDPRRFVRINRSALVSVHHIRELQPWFHGEYKVILADGTALTLTRTYRSRLPSLLDELPIQP
jgi:two-component system LytT family response regulator